MILSHVNTASISSQCFTGHGLVSEIETGTPRDGRKSTKVHHTFYNISALRWTFKQCVLGCKKALFCHCVLPLKENGRIRVPIYGTVEVIDMNFLQLTRFESENSFLKDKRFSGIQHSNIGIFFFLNCYSVKYYIFIQI